MTGDGDVLLQFVDSLFVLLEAFKADGGFYVAELFEDLFVCGVYVGDVAFAFEVVEGADILLLLILLVLPIFAVNLLR